MNTIYSYLLKLNSVSTHRQFLLQV